MSNIIYSLTCKNCGKEYNAYHSFGHNIKPLIYRWTCGKCDFVNDRYLGAMYSPWSWCKEGPDAHICDNCGHYQICDPGAGKLAECELGLNTSGEKKRGRECDKFYKDILVIDNSQHPYTSGGCDDNMSI
jgi:ribosomal protein S27AE